MEMKATTPVEGGQSADTDRCPKGDPTDYFPIPDVPSGVFDVALVLGGTVSAGSYTGGVLDFLFEALDEWDSARVAEASGSLNDKRPVPSHRVRIRIITGTSGGGINAVLASRALHYKFAAGAAACNPFYEVWVNDINIEKLLELSDLDDVDGIPPPIVSILNGNVLADVARKYLGDVNGGNNAMGYPSAQQLSSQQVHEVMARGWIYNPLTVIVTHTNLSGIPYSQTFTGQAVSAEFFSNHADYVRLYLGYASPEEQGSSQIKFLPDAKFVNLPQSSTYAQIPVPTGPAPVPWPLLAQNVLGTSAFPLGFPARVVQRHGANYAYRFVWDNIDRNYKWITPLWDQLSPPGTPLDKYAFMSLDGGCTDNEPITLAAQTLEGLHAPQYAGETDAVNADRAILLVDPLCDPLPPPVVPGVMALTSLLAPTLQMFIRSNRFATADMAGFLRSDVFNRFLIAPKGRVSGGKNAIGGDALCAEGLGAFMGFLHTKFREHDFMLGRRNCQAFLCGTFTLSEDNLKVFVGKRPQLPADYEGPRPPDGECPVIPLYGSAAKLQPDPQWPTNEFKSESISSAIQDRVAKMMSRMDEFLCIDRFGAAFLDPIVDHVLVPHITKKLLRVIDSELQRKGL